MAISRRDMLLRSSALGAGVLAVGNVDVLLTSKTALANGRGNDAGHSNPHDATDYGQLVSDPDGLLELPEGFSYRIVSRADVQSMPGFYDGTGAFRGRAGSVGIVRNSELNTSGISTVSKVSSDFVYDPSRFGGTTTVVIDKNGNKVEMAAAGVTVSGQKVVVKGTTVMLAGEGGEPIIKGQSFLTLFATHVHPTAMGPSGPPIPQGEMSSLSSKVLTS